MLLEEDLYNFNPWWETEFKSNLKDRPKYLNILEDSLERKEILILTGLRRTGKTSLLKLLIERLAGKIDPTRILYISLDSITVVDYTIHELIREFRKVQKINRSEKIYLFFDEAAYKENIHQELKNLYDSENVKIFVSSSSASLLKDKNALLTGRTRLLEVLPLDFNEYLSFCEIDIKKSELYLREKYFEEYMQVGGIPEYIFTKDVSYLDNLIDSIIYKDIAFYYGVKDINSLKDYFRLLMERAGKQLSINKVANIIGISTETSKRYFQYFLDTFLVYAVERCGKLNERLRSPKKVYVADLGIKNFITGFRDKGAIFENLVFLKIKHYKPCYVYKDGAELDFYIDKKLIEVKYGGKMEKKQKILFDTFPATEKIIVDNLEEFGKL